MIMTNKIMTNKILNKILVIDDVAEIRKMLKSRLASMGYEVVTAEDGEKGLKTIYGDNISLVLLDQMMPGMDGMETLRRIGLLQKPPPVIMMTAHGSLQLAVAFLKSDGSDFIEKPIDFDVLDIKIKKEIQTLEKFRKEESGRIEAQEALKRTNEELAERVKRRTSKLSNTNKELLKKIEESKIAYEKLLYQEKRAIVGDLVVGLSHELRNQLNVINLLDLIEAKLSRKDKEYIRYVFDARDRVINLIDEVRGLVRNEDIKYNITKQKLSLVIDEAIFLLKLDRAITYKNITTEYQFLEDAFFDKDKIIQVILNLLRNATHAIKGKENGKITIRTEKKENFALIDIIDNGIGIEHEELKLIWEPLFTTKGEIGTGIGLDISKRIVEGHNGQISCLSKLNQGSTFTFSLPVASP